MDNVSVHKSPRIHDAIENARAIGEVTEIFPFFTSASGSPTICQTFFSPVSSSIRRHRSPEFDGIAEKLRHVDYFGTRELVF